jgi:ABC-type glutathione transport system ATPase component
MKRLFLLLALCLLPAGVWADECCRDGIARPQCDEEITTQLGWCTRRLDSSNLCSPGHLLEVMAELADAYGVSYKGKVFSAASGSLLFINPTNIKLTESEQLRKEAADHEELAKSKRQEADRLDRKQKAEQHLRDVLKECTP